MEFKNRFIYKQLISDKIHLQNILRTSQICKTSHVQETLVLLTTYKAVDAAQIET